MSDILTVLEDLHLPYEICEHPAVYTVAEANQLEGRLTLRGAGCKNLFLKHKDRFFLYVLPGDRRADLKNIGRILGVGSLKFASGEELWQFLGLKPGEVTPLGIVNDTGTVEVLIHRELVGKTLLLHPNRNTATISLTYENLLYFIQWCGNPWQLVE